MPVATRAVAWIETPISSVYTPLLCPSPPVRWRGLKHYSPGAGRVQGGESPPVRWRGLKQFVLPFMQLTHKVATRAVAWIETFWDREKGSKSPVATRAVAWIETFLDNMIKIRQDMSPPVRWRGLKPLLFPIIGVCIGRHPCGGVD